MTRCERALVLTAAVPSGAAPGKEEPSTVPFPSSLDLAQNAPNPFNPQTEIAFELARAGNARLTIYDVSGRLVRTLHEGHLDAAHHTMAWAGRDDRGRAVASGVYYLRVEVGGSVAVRPVRVVR